MTPSSVSNVMTPSSVQCDDPKFGVQCDDPKFRVQNVVKPSCKLKLLNLYFSIDGVLLYACKKGDCCQLCQYSMNSVNSIVLCIYVFVTATT